MHNYAKIAYDQNLNDKKIKEFYNEVKAKFDAAADRKKAAENVETDAPAKEEEKVSELAEKPKTTETTTERKGLKRVIVTDPEDSRASKAAPTSKKEDDPVIIEEEVKQ